jgi:hypothetical protein
MHSDVAAHNRDHDPTELLNSSESLFVPEHFVAPDVPFDTLVFSGHPGVGPCEVDSPALTVAAMDFVLQFGQGQTVIDHYEASFAFHGGLGSSVRELEKLAHPDDPTPAPLFVDRVCQLGGRTPS